MLGPFRHYHVKHLNHAALALTNTTLGEVINGIVTTRNYSSDKKDGLGCCQDVSQTAGMKVEPWPKPDQSPQPWRPECQLGPQPPNYDPYRIKVPDTVVPPLPPSNVKEIPSEDATELFKDSGFSLQSNSSVQDMFHNSPIVHPDYWRDKPSRRLSEVVKEVLPNLGYHGKIKYKYAFHEPWKPLDRMTLLEEAEKEEMDLMHGETLPMMEFACKKQRGPCSLKPLLDPPPPPPPPPPPFPWIYVVALVSFFGAFGTAYKLYLWREMKLKTSDKVIWQPRRKVKRPNSERDLPDCVQYLIIGAGAAGWAAYRAIAQHDKTAKVFFITKEDSLPYRRPPLSKFMWWNKDPPDIMKLHYVEDSRRKTMYNAECIEFMDPIKFYRKKTGPAVSIASGWCVLRIDPDDHVVWVKTFCGERPIYYERCLLAPGVKPKSMSIIKAAPKRVRDKICLMRTIRDLEIAFRKVKEATHVTVIGGGPLGCELAWYLGKMNTVVERNEEEEPPKEVVHVYKDKGVLSGILPEYLGVYAAEQIKCAGVTQIPKTQVYDVFETKDGRLELTLSNGKSIVTDYAFLAIGAEPRVDIAEDSTLERDYVNGGYLVNTELEARTHLYIAGDAASYYQQWRDTRLRVEHYNNAEEQGYIAGANMTGYWLPCNMEPNFWVQLGETFQMEVVGEVGACMPIVGLFKECTDEESIEDADRLIPTENPPKNQRKCYKANPMGTDYFNRYKRGVLFYLRDETVVGFVFWNLPAIDDRKRVCEELLRAKPSYKDINLLAELLGFPGVKCVYKPAELIQEEGPCLTRERKW